MIELSETQAAYLAGLIDGEGSLESQRQVQVGGRTPRFVLRLSFVFATAEPTATVAQWLGLKPTFHPSVDVKRSARYRLHIPKGTAVQVLGACMPYLILKQRQAKLVLAIEAVRKLHSPDRHLFRHSGSEPMPQEAVQQMDELHKQLRALKSNKRRAELRTLI